MFKTVESLKLANFNSANSSDFLDLCTAAFDEKILVDETRIPSKTFAPSQIRCKRISWFRLRGVQPEAELAADRSLSFTAQVGTCCHQAIQEVLSKKLGAGWVDPEYYLIQHADQLGYKFKCHRNGYETQVELIEPVPMKFAPDGIIYWKGKHWLLEIKTSEYSSFDKLTGPKLQHVDQIKCYATVLGIPNVLVLYQDRMYGNLKCFEVTVSDVEMQAIKDMFAEVLDCVDKNIAPPKLPVGDSWCTPSRCRYYYKCKEW